MLTTYNYYIIQRNYQATPPLKERSITVREILESSKQLRSEMILGWHVKTSFGQTIVHAIHIFRTTVTRLITESHEVISHFF